MGMGIDNRFDSVISAGSSGTISPNQGVKQLPVGEKSQVLKRLV
jgi:hypothetical protein